MREKKILMLSSQFIPEIFGGAIHQCFNLSKELQANNCDVTVLTSRNNFKLPKYETLSTVKIVRLFSGAPPQVMGKYTLNSFLWMINCFFWYLKNHKKFDVIHVHQAKFQAVVAALFKKISYKPVIVKVGNSDKAFDLASLKRKKFFGKFFYKTVIKNTTYFIAISNEIKKNFAEYKVKTSKVLSIPNGVYQEYSYTEIQLKKKELRRNFQFNNQCKYYISAGRISHEKNILLLLDAFAEAIIQKPFIRLIILGDGPQKKECEEFIQHKKLNDFVSLKGYVKNVKEYMIAGDFFLLPSLVEGMSNSLLEAMSMGLIPIGSNISGNKDLINDSNGFLIDKPYKENLKNIFLQTSNLDSRRISAMQNNNYETIKSTYKMQHIAGQYINLYKALIDRYGRNIYTF